MPSSKPSPQRVFLVMKVVALLGILAISLLLLFGQEPETSFPMELSVPDFQSSYRQTLPVFKWDNSEGQTLASEDFIGHWTLLHFWAQWCLPCLAELPLLNEFERNWGDRTELKVLLINSDGEGSPSLSLARDFLKEHSIQMPNYYDLKGELKKFFQVERFPTHFLINPQGVIVFEKWGSIDWKHPKTKASLIKLLEAASKEPSPKTE